MQTIVDSAPVEAGSILQLPSGEQVQTRPRQVLVWMSVTPTTFIALPTGWPRFPAVVDSGFNSTFLISERQLERWAGIKPGMLPAVPGPKTKSVRVRGQTASVVDAFLRLYPNVQGHGDISVRAPAKTLYAEPGISITPASRELTRFPLLGTLALESNGLSMALDPLPNPGEPGQFKLHLTIRSVLAE